MDLSLGKNILEVTIPLSMNLWIALDEYSRKRLRNRDLVADVVNANSGSYASQ
jgi:hypothetical protein